MKVTVTTIIVLAVLAGLVYYFNHLHQTTPAPSTGGNPSSTTTTPTANSTSTVASSSSMVLNVNITANSIVTSPVTVTGEARGNWYFEASFPIKITDANGHILGSGPASAQGDWMVTNFVGFKSTITFSTSTTATGFLILEKDNPSGLLQNAAEIKIPIRFR